MRKEDVYKEERDEIKFALEKVIGGIYFLFGSLTVGLICGYILNMNWIFPIVHISIFTFTFIVWFIHKKMKARKEINKLDVIPCRDPFGHSFRNLKPKTICKGCGNLVKEIQQRITELNEEAK